MSRPLTITVQNNTSLGFTANGKLTHGEWDTAPGSPLAAGAGNTWTANERMLTGAQGTVTYTSDDSSVTYVITFNHPVGASATTVNVTVNNGSYTSSLTNDNLQHHDASCTISFSKMANG